MHPTNAGKERQHSFPAAAAATTPSHNTRSSGRSGRITFASSSGSPSPVVIGRSVTGVGVSVVPSRLGHFNLVDGEIERPPL
jgi:hypothetical protein